MAITTSRALFEALDRRGIDAAEKAAFDQRIWEELGTEATVLVTDLSGFTRITQSHGILHFLAIFRRFTQHCEPLFVKHGGRMVRHEADDLIGVFTSPKAAAECALEMMRRVKAVNATLPETDHIGLSIGLEHGRFLLLEDDLYGDPVNLAYKLGEDLAERDEILIGKVAFERATADGLDLSGCVVSPAKRPEVSKVMIEHHSVRLAD